MGCPEKLRETSYFSLVRSFLEYSVAPFVKDRYRRFESVTQMLEQLTWIPLSKRCENSRLFLFYQIINYLAEVSHPCLEKAKINYSQKFHHTLYVDLYEQSFFPNSISNTLDIFKSKLLN